MNRTPKEISNALKLVYTDNLIKYRITHMRQHPALLLSILLLSNIDTYKEVTTNIQEFYEANKKNILEQINKVIKDFNFTEEKLLSYDGDNLVKDDSFNLMKVFSSSIEILFLAISNNKINLINIINEYVDKWHEEPILKFYLSGDLSNGEPLDLIIKRRKRIRGNNEGE